MLNYLRDGTVVLPAGTEARAGLRQEAEFYNLVGLVRAVDAASAAEVARVQALLAALESALTVVDRRLELPESSLQYIRQVGRHVAMIDTGSLAQLTTALATLDGQRHRLLQAKAAALAELRALGA